MLTEVKSIPSKFRISEVAITGKVTIAIGNGPLSTRCPEKKWLKMVAAIFSNHLTE